MNLITITEEQEALIRQYTGVEVKLIFTLDLDEVPEEHLKFIETVTGKNKLNIIPPSSPVVASEQKTRKQFRKVVDQLTVNRFGLNEDITYKNGTGTIVKLWKMYNFLMNDYTHGKHTTRQDVMDFFKRNGDTHAQASAHVLALVKKGVLVEGHLPVHKLEIGRFGCIAEAA